MSFTSLDGAFIWEFVAFENYIRIFKDPNSFVILRNTLVFVGCSLFLVIVLDLFIAIMTTYFIRDEKWGSFFKAMIMIPMITPAVIYSVLWIWFLDASDQGLINKVLNAIIPGFESTNWIATFPFQTIIIAQLLVSLAYGAIIFSGAIKSIPENQFKAAHVDGASEWEIIKVIIIPNIRHHIKFIALWEALGLLTNYITILLITDGGPLMATEVWALSAYHKAFIDQQYGYGAAISVILILVVFLLMSSLQFFFNRNANRER